MEIQKEYMLHNFMNYCPPNKYLNYLRAINRPTLHQSAFNRQLKKITKSKSVFPTDDSLFKMLWTLRKNGLAAELNGVKFMPSLPYSTVNAFLNNKSPKRWLSVK